MKHDGQKDALRFRPLFWGFVFNWVNAFDTEAEALEGFRPLFWGFVFN